MLRTRSLILALFLITLAALPALAQLTGGTTTQPDIYGFTPAAGPPGTVVTVSGVGFQTGATARIGSVSAPFTFVSATQFRITVPAGAVTGTIYYQKSFTATAASGDAFVVTTSTVPSITGFSPSSGRAGDSIDITGVNFQSGAKVTFAGGVAATTTYFNSATSLTAVVPAGAASGPLTVTTTGGTATSSQSFTVTTPAPAITSFSPTAAHAGDVVSINGTALDGVSSVTFNGAAATFKLVGGVQIQATVPANASSGPIRVSSPSGSATSPTPFTLLVGYAPAISGFSPTSGRAGTVVDVSGGNLDRIDNAGFNGVAAAALTRVSATLARITVPQGATSGPITVSGPDGSAVSAAPFQVLLDPPAITGFTPGSGRAGDTVTITGTNFDSTARASFNGVAATTSLQSATSIAAVVPATASSGPLRVTTASGAATSAQSFTVLASQLPTITSFSPGSGAPGATILISGTNLTTTRFVFFNGVAATFTASATSVSAKVPATASSGKILVRTDYGDALSATSFAVIAAKPAVTISTSLAGRVLAPGSIVAINWSTSSAVTLLSHTVELSTDGGETYTNIANLAATARSYSWTIPVLATTRGVLRVTARDVNGGAGSDITDGTFTLGGAAGSVEPGPQTPEIIEVMPGQPALFQRTLFCKNGVDCFTVGIIPNGLQLSDKPFFTNLSTNSCPVPQLQSCGPESVGDCGRYLIHVPVAATAADGDYPIGVTISAGAKCQIPNPTADKFIIRVRRPAAVISLGQPQVSVNDGQSPTQTVTIQRRNFGGGLRFEVVADPSDPDGLFGGNVVLNPSTLQPNADVDATERVSLQVVTYAPDLGQTPTRPGTSKLLIRAIGDGIDTAQALLTVDVTLQPALFMRAKNATGPVRAGETATFNVAVLRYNFSDPLALQVDCSTLLDCTYDIGPEQVTDIESGQRSLWMVQVHVPYTAANSSYPVTFKATHSTHPEVVEPTATADLLLKKPSIQVVELAAPSFPAPACGSLPFKVTITGFNQITDVTLKVDADPNNPSAVDVHFDIPTFGVLPGPDGYEMSAKVSVPGDAVLDRTYNFTLTASESGGATTTLPFSVLVARLTPVQLTATFRPDKPKFFQGRPITINGFVDFSAFLCSGAGSSLTRGLSVTLAETSGVIKPPVTSQSFPSPTPVQFTYPGAPAKSFPYTFVLSGTSSDGQPLAFTPPSVDIVVTDQPFITISSPQPNATVPGGSRLQVSWETEADAVTQHLVLLDGAVAAGPLSGTAQEATVAIPNPLEDQAQHTIAVQAFNGPALVASEEVTFFVSHTEPVKISGFKPLKDYPGFTFAIEGDGLVPGSIVEVAGVQRSGFNATVTEITGLEIPVVDGDATGETTIPVTVTAPDGSRDSAMFPVLSSVPTISAVQPSTAKVGDTIRIIGTGFVKDNVTQVVFGTNAMVRPVIFTSSSEIQVQVPDTTLQGITVQTRYGESNKVDFTPMKP